MYLATFTFADGETCRIPIGDGQSVLDAAIQAEAPIRYDCASGTCGACIAHCIGGAITMEDAPALSPSDRACGLTLTCQTQLRSDADFALPYPRHPQPSEPARHRARILEVGRSADTVHRLVLELDDPETFQFQSGQYVRLRVPGTTVARAYSMASTIADLPNLEFMIRHMPGGVMSSWLEREAKAGDRMQLHGPLGPFGLDIRAARHVFIAGGTGLAPVASMARSLAPGGAEALVCFGCTRPGDLFYQDEMAALARDGLETRTALMDPGDTNLAQGTALDLLTPQDLAGDACFYLCGPPGMVEAAQVSLTAAGVSIDRIRAERFQPGG